jgi:hypothetical protein
MSETQKALDVVDEQHAKRWRANVFLFEQDSETVAQAILETGANEIHGSGRATRNPADPQVAEIGDELAAGRALIGLGRRLLGITESDIEALTGHTAHVSE